MAWPMPWPWPWPLPWPWPWPGPCLSLERQWMWRRTLNSVTPTHVYAKFTRLLTRRASANRPPTESIDDRAPAGRPPGGHGHGLGKGLAIFPLCEFSEFDAFGVQVSVQTMIQHDRH